MKRTAKSIFRKFSPEEKERLARLQAQIEEEKPEILARARAYFAAQEAAKEMVSQLKTERERQGLSLSDIQERTGITKGAISLLETSDSPNPTLKTLQRYALALGLRVAIE